MKLYKALCITGAVTMIAMVAALIMSPLERTENNHRIIVGSAKGDTMLVIAFGLVVIFTVMLITAFIKRGMETRRDKKIREEEEKKEHRLG